MQVVYAREPFPNVCEQSIFLMGPTPRRSLGKECRTKSWRPEALKILEKRGYRGHVFVPEDREGVCQFEYDDQVAWEHEGIKRADCLLTWLPRNKTTMLGLTTNVEFGWTIAQGRTVLGAPPGAFRVRYLAEMAKKYAAPQGTTLQETVDLALLMVRGGARREGGECRVPLHVWRSEHFQLWYDAQKNAGNRLDDARLEWVFRIGPQQEYVFFFALWVKMWVASEGRHKSNELLITRPSIATVVMYERGRNALDTRIVLVREFRSPASTVDGFVREVPGGSTMKLGVSPLELAAHEVGEEVGFTVDPARLVAFEHRQLAATAVGYRAHLFSLELTHDEMEAIEANADQCKGVAEDTEQTYREIVTYGELVREQRADVDWGMLGMISRVVFSLY